MADKIIRDPWLLGEFLQYSQIIGFASMFKMAARALALTAKLPAAGGRKRARIARPLFLEKTS